MFRSRLLSLFTVAASATILLVPAAVSAHEAYVLPGDYFWDQLQRPFSWRAWAALADPANLRMTLSIIFGVFVALTLNFIFRRSRAGKRAARFVERLAPLGPLFVRAAIAIALFYSALSWSFLGPELSLHALPFAQAMRLAIFAISVLIAFGLFTELAAAVGILIFTIGFWAYGAYLLTYLNYLGELIVLLLFGMRQWSLDHTFFGPLKRLVHWEKYETSIVRICYGLALCYAGITVKFLHPDLTEHVVTTWNLTQFHWLFPSDPLLVTLGAGLAELAIGLFILVGFEMRLTVAISLFYITLSLLFFRELVWPHLLLYGISLNLLVQPEVFTIDHILFPEGRRRRRGKPIPLWHHPFLPHGNKKTSA